MLKIVGLGDIKMEKMVRQYMEWLVAAVYGGLMIRGMQLLLKLLG